MHNLIKRQLDAWVKNDEYTDYLPKKSRNLKAVSFESKQPIDGNNYLEYLFQCIQWGNGEGYDFSIHSFNEKTKQSTDKTISFHMDEIDGILFCLKDLEYFV